MLMLLLVGIFCVAVLVIVLLLIVPQHWFGGGSTRSTKPADTALLARQAKIQAQQRFASTLEHEAVKLQKTLQQQAADLDSTFQKQIQDITSKQLKEYEQALGATLQKTLQQLHAAADTGEQERKNFAQAVAEQKTKALAQANEAVDKHVAEILMSYLAEVAGELDYQQQKNYLYHALEANKEAIKKDIARVV